MRKVKIYSGVIIPAGLLGFIIGFVLGKLGVPIMVTVLICGLTGGFFGQKMLHYLDKRIN